MSSVVSYCDNCAIRLYRLLLNICGNCAIDGGRQTDRHSIMHIEEKKKKKILPRGVQTMLT